MLCVVLTASLRNLLFFLLHFSWFVFPYSEHFGLKTALQNSSDVVKRAVIFFYIYNISLAVATILLTGLYWLLKDQKHSHCLADVRWAVFSSISDLIRIIAIKL